jgi:hypothetical protein
MGRLGNSFELMGASWGVLKKDKEILLLPVISGISVIVMLAAFVVPAILANDPDLLHRLTHEDRQTAMAVGFTFYFLNYLIIIFFNAAIVACATIRMNGGDPTILDGLNMASSRIFKIIQWAFVAATVGLILRIIQGRSNILGRILAGLMGTAWSLASYLVVPILVNANEGPVEAFMDSVRLLKRTWGENLIGSFGFGLIFAIAFLPALIVIAVGTAMAKGMFLVPLLVLTLLYLLLLAVVQSALQGIFQSALYQFATTGRVHGGFREDQLRNALSRKE